MKLRGFLAGGALVGAMVPAVLWARYAVTQELFGTLESLLWPPSILLMALENSPGPARTWGVIAASVLLNILWYVALAGVIYMAYRLINKVLVVSRAEP